MKKYYPIDLIFIGLSVILAFLLARKADMPLSTKPSLAAKTERAGGKPVKNHAAMLFSIGDESSKELKDRNIFSADGRYPVITAQGKKDIPEVAYTLLGVMRGREKKAVFREYTGAVLAFGVGAKMIDDSVVADIGSLSVKVKKGKKEREYRIFHLEKK